MRPILRITALILVLLALLVPLVTYARQVCPGGCPDDPVGSANCNNTAPPWYVVINREVAALDRPGTGCQPIILSHPECTTCTGADCSTIDIQAEVCQNLPAANGDILYALCCNCASDPAGSFMFRVYTLDGAGGCQLTQDWTTGLPPGTGIDLPAPVIIGGLAVLGLALVGVGMVVRRRTLRTA
jgi:hypothetical protein